MTNQPGELGAAIEQIDRDAAAAYLMVVTGSIGLLSHDDITAGRWDDTPHVQAFARHRISATPTRNDGAGDVIRDALVRSEAALAAVDAGVFRTFKFRNGRERGIEADDGEACDIMHSDITAECREALGGARAALSALSQKGGGQLVPVEPTEAMIDAGDAAHFRKRNDMTCIAPTEHPDEGGGPFGYAWRAMLDAAPVSAPHGGDVG